MVKTIFFLVSVFSLIQASYVLADERDNNETTTSMVSESFNLEKKQVEQIVNRLVVSGRITKEEAQKAKREIASISDSSVQSR